MISLREDTTVREKKFHCSFKNFVNKIYNFKKIVINITKLFLKFFKAVNLSLTFSGVANNYLYVYTIHIRNSFL